MTTPFDDWLAYLKAAKKGPVALYARRGVIFSTNVKFTGDYTGTTMRGEIRLTPDAAGLPEETFNVSVVSVVDDESTFNVALPAANVTALQAAPPGEGFATFAYDLLITKPSDNEEILFGGPFYVYGRITE